MTPLSDRALDRLRVSADAPDLSATRYRLLDRLSSGGMGTIWLAEDTELAREVALKVVTLPEAGGDTAGRLLREAQVLARLEHPGIVPVHDAGLLPDGRAFYVMKRVRGESLDVRHPTPPPLRETLRILSSLCDAVAFAHSREILHLDLKPGNVMIGEFGEVLVMDWGVAAVGRREGASPSGLVFGTPAYMSPEQAFGRGEQITERTDVYGLGGVLHFLLTGRAPSAARTAEEARGIFEGGGPGAVIEAPVAKPLRAICRKALAADPLERYAGPLELSADLVRFESALPVSAYRETVLERAGRWISRYRVPILLVGAYLFIRVLLLLLGGR